MAIHHSVHTSIDFMKSLNVILKEGWWYMKLLNTDTLENYQWNRLFHGTTRTIHIGKFVYSKLRSDSLGVFYYGRFSTQHFWNHSFIAVVTHGGKSRALPEMYLLSMGQFLCVVMTMIDSKRTHKTDLQQFTCTFVSWQKEPWIY